MYSEAVHSLADQAAAKLREQRRSLAGHLVRSALAGMYVGAAIVLIFTIGGLLSKAAHGLVCLGGWLAVRVKSETARVLLIWWCMFTFITSGYEHSVANM